MKRNNKIKKEFLNITEFADGKLEGGFEIISLKQQVLIIGGEGTNNCDGGNCVAGCGQVNNVAGCGGTNTILGCGGSTNSAIACTA